MRSTSKRRAAVAMLVTGLMTIGAGFTLAGTAAADSYFDESQYDLHLKGSHVDDEYSGHHGGSWADFWVDGDECDNARTTEDLPYAWHFVVPDYPANPNALPDVTAVYAYFDGAGEVTGGHVVQNGKGWYLYTANADVLLDAVGDSTADEESPVEMNLSHTCGPEGQSSSSSSSSSTSSSSESSSSESSSSESSSSESSSSESSSSVSSSVVSSSSESSSSESSSSESSSSASVLSSVVENTSSSADSSVAGVSVQGVEVTRSLPRTGFDPGLLLMLGGVLVVSGVLMLRYSNETA